MGPPYRYEKFQMSRLAARPMVSAARVCSKNVLYRSISSSGVFSMTVMGTVMVSSMCGGNCYVTSPRFSDVRHMSSGARTSSVNSTTLGWHLIVPNESLVALARRGMCDTVPQCLKREQIWSTGRCCPLRQGRVMRHASHDDVAHGVCKLLGELPGGPLEHDRVYRRAGKCSREVVLAARGSWPVRGITLRSPTHRE